RWSPYRYERNGGYLKRRHACSKDDQRPQEERKGWETGRWDEQQGADRHCEQARHHRALVSDPLDNLAGRKSKDRVGEEEHKLDQRDPGVVQVEYGFEVRYEDVIQRGEKSPHEEQRGDHRKRTFVA